METLGLLSLAKKKLSGNRITPSVYITLNSTVEGEGYRCLNRKLAWEKMGINTFQMEILKRFYRQRKKVVVFGHGDPQERCNISSEQHVVPCGGRDGGYGWKETHSTAVSPSAGEVVYLCGDGKSRTRLVGEIWRDRKHVVVRMTNQKGHDKLGKENVYFLAFECVSHPVENKINSFIKSTCRVR